MKIMRKKIKGMKLTIQSDYQRGIVNLYMLICLKIKMPFPAITALVAGGQPYSCPRGLGDSPTSNFSQKISAGIFRENS